MNDSGEQLLHELIGETSKISQESVYKILSIQDRIQKDIQSGKWQVRGKKKRGGHLDLEKFRDTLLKNI